MMYYKTLGLGYLFWSTDASGSPIEPTTQAMESSVTCLWKVVDAQNDLSSILFPPTRTSGQIQADKTCMQWLTKIAGRLA